nr:MAG TPA: hypothetical protein [Caudoviricetes sp.]
MGAVLIHKFTTFVDRASDSASTTISTHLMLRCCSLHHIKGVTISASMYYDRSRTFVSGI